MKKNTTRLVGLSFSALLAIFFLVTSNTLASAAEYVSVKNDGANIRSAPNTKGAVLWEVFKGFPLKIVNRKDDWAEVVDFEGDKGWIFASLLDKKKTVIIKVDSANMRSGPNTDASVVATVKKGVVFTPLEKKGAWVKVSYKDDITGWMHNTLIWPSDI
ncbi:MAG: hypothetical protein A2521_15565 [Deltaproteobacteria bacterium RIFOXYD12_FULL_57_12]|nr:MAG: hypothetical protein A2521_15565 [Deltaproteobacteria bacterium RIFOXYD12_FULL_57_12]